MLERKSNQQTNILAIDDARDILALLEFELTDEGYEVFVAENGAAGLGILSENKIDLILLDIVMPNMSGLEVLKQIKKDKTLKDIPVIMLSASEQSDDIVSSLDLGADDFVNKPYISEVLLARMRTSLRLREKNRALEKMALTDFLTGINNRRQFYTLSNAALSRNNREQSPLTIALMDIDHFKHINDTYGHDIGDLVLVEFSKVLAGFFREYDIVGRVGGEEFCVCLPDTNIENGVQACERFRKEFSNHPISVSADGQSFKLTVKVSIGITESLGNAELEMLIKQADKALYMAKNRGRDNVTKYLHEF